MTIKFRSPRAQRYAGMWLVGLLSNLIGIVQTIDVAAQNAPDRVNDHRFDSLKDLNGYFPFNPPESTDAWTQRADWVRRQISVSAGLWPMPTKTPLNSVISGKIDCEEYTVENVYFESVPGFFVTGNLYRPAKIVGRVPGVLFAHGHWQDARLTCEKPATVRREIATGEERFERGGQSLFQSMCVQLARMGCVVWQWDMLSDSDAIQLPREVIHTFAKQRPEMNTPEKWGLFSPRAESHLQSVLGLQTLNAIRSLDFLLSLPEVDPNRTAITGASGGGTQTMLLSAIDSRIQLSYPAVMVSTAMQGGCTCENASLLRIGTGNVEFAALFAPKPQGMTTANDWTREMSTKGFPELLQLYRMLGAADRVMLHRGEHFPHNYNAVSRSGFYTWLNRHFGLGLTEPVIERDFEPLKREQLTVWNEGHPAPPAGDPEFERGLLQWLTQDATSQIERAARNPDTLQSVISPAMEIVLGRRFADAGATHWHLDTKADRGHYVEMHGTVDNTTHQESVAVVWLYPKASRDHVTLWLSDAGKSGLWLENGELRPAVQSLLTAGHTVLAADQFSQGSQNRTVPNPREFAGYTYGYNHALFAQRVHDVLTLINYTRTAKVGSHPPPASVNIVGIGDSGIVATAARALCTTAIDRAVIDTQGFRFQDVDDYRNAMFLPGGAKYLDVPGLLALGAPGNTFLAGERELPEFVALVYRQLAATDRLILSEETGLAFEQSGARWLSR